MSGVPFEEERSLGHITMEPLYSRHVGECEIVPINEVSSFQGYGLEEFHCTC